MKKSFYLLLLCSFISMPLVASELKLIHLKGTHSVGLRAGTGFAQTWDVGASYNYQFHPKWGFDLGFDYENGQFGKSHLDGLVFSPGVEFAVWKPCSWLYVHLRAHVNLGWDWWQNSVTAYHQEGFNAGIDLGINFEAYVLEELSFSLCAQENFAYCFYDYHQENNYYFKPLFTLGVSYHIQ